MNNPRIYVLLNGELKMSPGKAAAQAVHASMMLENTARKDFIGSVRRTVIVLEAKNAEQIKNLSDYLNETTIDHEYYIDEGVNEVDAYSVTALAVYVGEDESLNEIFEAFPLYGGHIQVRLTNEFGFNRDRVTVPGNIEISSRFLFNKLKKASNETR